MIRVFLLAATLLLSAGAVSAQTIQTWTPGWDIFSEPLNFTQSSVKWSVGTVGTTKHLTITYKLVHATPNKLYQVGVHVFCDRFPATFGRFPVRGRNSDGTCPTDTRVNLGIVESEFGVVTTDIHGNGLFTVCVGPIASGTYNLEFHARNGAGCLFTGGDCNVDFQSPGPLGTATTIIVP